MVDRAITAHPLAAAWLGLSRRVAVAAGALAALVSLIFDTPVWVASLRGAGTWFAVLVLAHVSRSALVASLRASRKRAVVKEPE